MKTLGDYSNLCRRLDAALLKVVQGYDLPLKTMEMSPELFELEHDGMVEIQWFDWHSNGKFDSVKITDKGRELLSRGGYSKFKNPLRENFDKTCLINYSDDRFFTPHPEDCALDGELTAIGGRCIWFNAFGRGYDFPMELKENVIALFEEYQIEYFEI